MTQSQNIIEAIQRELPDQSLDIRHLPIDESLITIPAEVLLKVSHLLVHEFGLYHLSTITGIDTGSEIEVLYHFWNLTGLTLRLVLPYGALQVNSLTELIPGAQFYEMEIAEMFGISVVGLDEAPLILPDDWESSPPLLKGEA